MLCTLKDVLQKAEKEKYAVGLFNTTDSDMLEAVIRAAEEERSAVIIGTAEILLPYGELKLIAPSMIAAAKRASVPVVVHYDHGLTIERVKEALSLGFTSVMYDGSAKSAGENLSETKEVADLAHALGATVEGEIGHVGNAEDGDVDTSRYTTVKEALDFASETGVDALAIAIGTAHGAYKQKPELDINRLSDIHAKVDIPLVLHGGSGLSDDDFRNAVSHGIAKVNIFTDLTLAGAAAMKEGIESGKDYLTVRNMKVDAICAEVKKKMRLFGSNNRY